MEHAIGLIVTIFAFALVVWYSTRKKPVETPEPQKLTKTQLRITPYTERRRDTRIVTAGRLFISHPRLPRLYSGWLVDYSKTGVGISTGDPFWEKDVLPGQQLFLKTRAGNYDDQKWTRVAIANATREPNGWRLGVQFVGEVDPQFWKAIGGKP